MAFKDRISGMFRFGGKGNRSAEEGSAAQDRSTTSKPSLPTPASEEEREELLQELGHGFTRVGNVLERLDHNLGAGVRSLEAVQQTQERLPQLIVEQQHLIRDALDQSAVTRNALQALSDHLSERDTTQQAIVDRLEQIGYNLRDQREQHDRQLQLVMSFHRSSRFMVAMLVLGAFLLIVILLGALLTVLLRPGLLPGVGTEDAATTATAPREAAAEPAQTASAVEAGSIDELIEAARDSDNPVIAERARAAD